MRTFFLLTNVAKPVAPPGVWISNNRKRGNFEICFYTE